MDQLLHILDRAFIHFYMAAGFLLMTLVAWEYATRKFRWWPRLNGWGAYAIPAFVIFTLISFREVFDVHNGQPLVKAITDWISWISGMAAAIWGLHRIFDALERIEGQIYANRLNRR